MSSTQAVALVGGGDFSEMPKEESANQEFILRVSGGATRWPDVISVISTGRLLFSAAVVSRLIEKGVRGGLFLPIRVFRVEGGTKQLRETSPPTYFLAMAEGDVELDVGILDQERRQIPIGVTGEDRSDVFNLKYRRRGVDTWVGFVGNIRFLEALRGFGGHHLYVEPLDFFIPKERRETFKINLKSKKWPPRWYPDWFTPHPSNLIED